MSVGGVVNPLVLPQANSISSVSTSSSLGEVDLGSVMLTIAVVGVCGYMLYQHLESRDRDRLYAY
jgi:hypothetical protein